MKPQPALNWLVPPIALFTLLAAAAGLFWPAGGGGPFTFTTLHGQTIQMYGSGLCHFNSLMKGATLPRLGRHHPAGGRSPAVSGVLALSPG